MGEEIHIAEESAIIIWDAAAKTQHFIRRASFETKAKDFGFIVPTPSVPKLAEADDAAFKHLDRVITPPRNFNATKKAVASAPAPVAPKVEVIAKAKVAGFDATVLSASDAGALDRWLKSNGYASSPELTEWYRHYIERKWYFTAFKIDGSEASGRRARGKAVRMSFMTEQPFFPYREPRASTSAIQPPHRSLEVYFIGDAKPDALLGGKEAWPGRTIWSKPMTDFDKGKVLDLLKLAGSELNGQVRLTVFRDSSIVRPDKGDLHFVTATDQSLVQHPLEVLDAQSKGAGASSPPVYTYASPYDPWDIIGYILAPMFLAFVLIALLKALQLLWWIGRKVAGR